VRVCGQRQIFTFLFFFLYILPSIVQYMNLISAYLFLYTCACLYSDIVCLKLRKSIMNSVTYPEIWRSPYGDAASPVGDAASL